MRRLWPRSLQGQLLLAVAAALLLVQGFSAFLVHRAQSQWREMAVVHAAAFRLLCAFLNHPRQVLDRDRLLDMVQGREAHLFDRAVDNQVSRLRRKMETDSRDPKLIQTVWGGGYRLAADVRRMAPDRA